MLFFVDDNERLCVSEQAQLKRLLRAKPLAAANDKVLLAIYNIISGNVEDAGLSSRIASTVALQICGLWRANADCVGGGA